MHFAVVAVGLRLRNRAGIVYIGNVKEGLKWGFTTPVVSAISKEEVLKR